MRMLIRVDFSMLLSCRVFCMVAYWWGQHYQYVGQIATVKVMLVLMSTTKMNLLGPNINIEYRAILIDFIAVNIV